ncbi:MAG: hypothetical protein HQL54_04430 [Magnetococcales bacterium]|nr:hypothetical protein [Magnetococcales bacterium]
MSGFDGGYYFIKEPLVRGGRHRHTAADSNDAISDLALNAINIIQATPWRINDWILAVCDQLQKNSAELPGVTEENSQMVLPDRPDDFSNRTEKEQQRWYRQVRAVKRAKRRKKSRVGAVQRTLTIARRLQNAPELYFGHFFDFRTRIYPMSQDLHPQGDEIARALLIFKQGRPLGQRGLFWLAVRMANCAGMDRLSYEQRVEWVIDHHQQIMNSGLTPLDGNGFWQNVEKPFSFLATCREWALAHQLYDPEQYLSRLPVPLDGSVNGIQHLSMLCKDHTGAFLTNCSSDPHRHDLYETIAVRVKDQIAIHQQKGCNFAARWQLDQITRKVVKRAVMTTPYGVTERGIRNQLLEDGHISGIDGNPVENAAFLQAQIMEAMGAEIGPARAVMDYFQAVAHKLALAKTPLIWTNPAGSRITQSYYRLRKKRIRTMVGQLVLQSSKGSRTLDARRQKSGSAPNVIHAFDAAHLQRSVVDCQQHYDIHDYSMIHDSFATHADNTDRLSQVLRRQMYEIYRTNPLLTFHQEMCLRAPPGTTLPDPPDLGSFNPKEVLMAPYFFS